MSRRVQLEKKLNDLEAVMLRKIDALTGYAADDVARIRYFINLLKFYDQTDRSIITYDDFHKVMLRFNFVGLTVEIEQLFNRYDYDLMGYVDCRDLACRLFGVSSHPRLSGTAEATMEQLRVFVIRKGLYAPTRFCKKIVTMCNNDYQSDYVPYEAALTWLCDFLASSRISRSHLQTLLRCYVNDGKVNIASFIVEFKAGMTYDRKRLIRAVFDKLLHGEPYEDRVRVHRIRTTYHAARDNVLVQRLRIEVHSVDDFLDYVLSIQTNHNHDVSWPAFLDYYRVLSLAIDEDQVFELLVRDSWQVRNGASETTEALVNDEESRALRRKGPGSPVRRRVVVAHRNGEEEVVDIVDELGTTRYNTPNLVQMVKNKGVGDISDIFI